MTEGADPQTVAEDLAALKWVDELDPDLEAALGPTQRAVLRALRRYRESLLGGKSKPVETKDGPSGAKES